MSTSGTYGYAPSLGELVAAAYARIQIRRSELVTEHFANAQNEINLLQVEWANKGPLLWTVDLQSIPLVEGAPTYNVLPSTIMVLDVYVSIPGGSDGGTIDRIITPISRTEYASMPEKLEQGAPTTYWFDRLIAPTITLWPTPDGFGPYTLNYYRFAQIQDGVFAGGTQPQIPYKWFDAYVAGLTHRLAAIYNPQLEAQKLSEAMRTYTIASTQDIEGSPLYIQPNASSYWRT